MSAPALDVSAFLRRYDATDRALVAAGMPATSRWWRAEIERFLRSARRRWVIRAGRRAGKSSTLARLAVCWAMHGTWHVPIGDIGVVAFVSVDRGEASARLRTIVAILRSLGCEFAERADEIELIKGRPALFRVATNSTKGTIGFTAILCILDEVAKYESRETGANNAKDVVASLAPTMATVPSAFMVLSSSPWGTEDFHAELFDAGDTAFQLTSFVQTWVANEAITQSDCHALAPVESDFERDYGGIPGATVSSNWFGDRALELAVLPFTEPLVPAAAQRAEPKMVKHTNQCIADEDFTRGCACASRFGADEIASDVRYIVAADQAFQHDRFAYAVASSQLGAWNEATAKRGPRVTRIHAVGAWKPDRSPREMARRLLTEVCHPHQTKQVSIDQHGGLPFVELCRDVGLLAQVVPWTSGDGESSKAARFRAVRLAMLEGAFKIPADPDLLRELRAVRGTLLPSGGERIEVVRSALGHGDRVAATVLAGSIALAGHAQLPSSRLTWVERRRAEEMAAFRDELLVATACGGNWGPV